MNSAVEVVAAVLTRPNGEVMLASRPDGKVYAGYWEFPGGKVEAGGSLEHALARELKEELGIEGMQATRWITKLFAYPHATVRLNFFRVCGLAMYSGTIFMALGWALWVHSWLTLGYAMVLFVFFDIKSRREEQWLKAKFAGYAAYQKRVRKLIPFVY